MDDNNEDNIDLKKKFKMPSKIKSYKIEKELYIISGAHVCLGTNTNINEKVLIKIYDKEIINCRLQESTFINNEIFMMKLINHRNALNLYEIIESPSYIFLIMEYFNGNRLVDLVNSKNKLSEDDALNIYKQIISFLLYIHEMNLGHLNLNYNNILVDDSNNIKISEFKYCMFYVENKRAKINISNTGEKSFLAPEIYSKKSCLPEMADIWSSGILLYFMTVGELPFYHQRLYNNQKIILKGEYKLPKKMNKNMQDFIKTIFEEDEKLRYNLTTIFNSDLFTGNEIIRNNLQNGLNILSVEYPIDKKVMKICQEQFDLDPEDIKKKLFKNIFDPYTSLYKQILSKFINEKIPSKADLTSQKFNSYISDEKHFFDEKQKKKNIQKVLNKDLEYNSKSKDNEKDINKNQQKVLNGLDELVKTYAIPQNKKHRESKSVDISKKRSKKKEEDKEKEDKEKEDKEKENKEIEKKGTENKEIEKKETENKETEKKK
jgi:serine/threonine protein kinase